MKKRWAIWVPWLKKFFTGEGGKIRLFDSEEDARDLIDPINAEFAKQPHLHGPGCKQCRYVVVPWDEQAEKIAEGGPT